MLKRTDGCQERILLSRNPVSASSTLIGSSNECDIVIRSPGVRPRHALIEFCPRTESFWLRQLDSSMAHKQQQIVPPPPPYPYEEHSSGPTREQVLQDGSIIELHPSDTLRFGKGPDAVEFVFKMPPLVPPIRTGPSRHPPSRSGSFGDHSTHRKKCSLDSDEFSLPVVGSRIQPRAHADRFARPHHTPHRRLCQLTEQQRQHVMRHTPDGVTMLRRSFSAVGESAASGKHAEEAQSRTRIGTPTGGWHSGATKAGPPERTESLEVRYATSGSSVDSDELPPAANASQKELLQRVQRLQNALARREEEIAQLREKVGPTDSEGTTRDSDGQRGQTGPDTAYQDALAKAHADNEMLRAQLLQHQNADGGEKRHAERTRLAPPHAHLSECALTTFFAVCAGELGALSTRLDKLPARDYADIFGELSKILHEPFSFRMMEVNSKCAQVFESLDMEASEREQLYVQFDHFLKDKIYPISKAVDAFLGTMREGAQMARDSARACTVFSQWSREFGDQLQLQPNWELMSFKVQDLQNRFREHGLPRHWLPPSLTPLLQVLIFEHRNRINEQKKRESEADDLLAQAANRIDELEKQLEQLCQSTSKIGSPTAEDSLTEPQIPRIELPLQQAPGDAKVSPRTPRSSRRTSSAALLGVGGTTDEEEQATAREAHIDTPRTPPPSQRQAAEQQKHKPEGDTVAEEESEEEPWGDTVEKGDQIAEEEGAKPSPRRQSPIAAHAALQSLNKIYDDLGALRRANSRLEQPASAGPLTPVTGADGGGRTFWEKSPDRAHTSIEYRWPNVQEAEDEGEAEEDGSERSGDEHEQEEEGEESARLAMYHLNTVYRELEEQRRKGTRSVVQQEEDTEKATGQSEAAHGPMVDEPPPTMELESLEALTGPDGADSSGRPSAMDTVREVVPRQVEDVPESAGDEPPASGPPEIKVEDAGDEPTLGPEIEHEPPVDEPPVGEEDKEFEWIERMVKSEPEGQEIQEKPGTEQEAEEDEAARVVQRTWRKRRENQNLIESKNQEYDEDDEKEEEVQAESGTAKDEHDDENEAARVLQRNWRKRRETQNLEAKKIQEVGEGAEEGEVQATPRTTEAEHAAEEDEAARVLQRSWRKRREIQNLEDIESQEQQNGAVAEPPGAESNAKSPESLEAGPERRKRSAVEFWEMARQLAALLEVGLPDRAHSGSSGSRPESAGERAARQRAVDSIMDRIQNILDQLRWMNNDSSMAEQTHASNEEEI